LEAALFWREGEVNAVAWDGLGPDWSSGCHGEEMVTWLGVRAKNVETRNRQEEAEMKKEKKYLSLMRSNWGCSAL
jgi:hypothetical protein